MTTYPYRALNFALQLPDDISELCVRANRDPSADSFCDLEYANNDPHINLAMGIFRVTDIPRIAGMLEDVLKKHHPLHLSIERVYLNHSSVTGHQLVVSKTPEIVELYRDVKDALCYERPRVIAEEKAFYVDGIEDWEPKTVKWMKISAYKRPENYKPNISLRCRNARVDATFPIDFVVDTFGIAQLGNYGTYRSVQRLISLKKQDESF